MSVGNFAIFANGDSTLATTMLCPMVIFANQVGPHWFHIGSHSEI